jgi:glycosyltransferase involved in cell wall biosynthesis
VAGKGEAGFAEALRAEYPAPAIEFAGHVEAAAFYDRVDVAVVPSLWNEPFGLTVLEALARGLPVIASRRGGIPELFAHGAAGCLVDPAQPGSLGRALRAFSGGGARRGAPAGLARFSPAAALEAYESLYDEALRAPARACA